LRKHHTSRLEAFSGGEAGPIGRCAPVRYFAPATCAGLHVPLPASSDDLPRVDVVYVGAGSSPDVLAAMVNAGARGVVLALPGNGSVPERWRSAIRDTVDAGIPVVRSSRAALGGVGKKPDDAELGTFAANELPASLARVALILGLASGSHETLARLLSPRD
jgi:L-asparaginase